MVLAERCGLDCDPMSRNRPILSTKARQRRGSASPGGRFGSSRAKPSAYSPGAAFIVMLDDGCAFGGRDRLRKIRTQPRVTGAREVLVTELIVP
jgi:hypothetical protein